MTEFLLSRFSVSVKDQTFVFVFFFNLCLSLLHVQEFPPLRVSESELVEVKSSDSSVMTPVGLLRFH